MNRDFRLFWGGQTATAFGGIVSMVALPLIAVEYLDATAFEVGLLVTAGGSATLIFGVPIATWADRLTYRRPFLIRADLVAAAVSLILAGLLLAGQLTVPTMIAAIFLLGLVGTFVETVYFVHLRGLVGDDQLVLARARLQVGQQIGGVSGNAAVGPLVAWVSAAAPFVADAITYLINALCLRSLRTREQPVAPSDPDDRAGYVRRMWEGIGEVRRRPFLRGLLPYLMLRPFAQGALMALMMPFLIRELGVPVAMVGLVFLLTGGTSVTGSLLSARSAKRDADPRWMVLWGFGLAPIPLVLLAMAGGPLLPAVALAAVGVGVPPLFGAIANVGLSGYLTRTVPSELLGRTGMSLQVVNQFSMVLGAPVAGLVADQLGLRPALAGAVALGLVAAGTLLPLARVVRAHPQWPEQLVVVGGAGPGPTAEPPPAHPAGERR